MQFFRTVEKRPNKREKIEIWHYFPNGYRTHNEHHYSKKYTKLRLPRVFALEHKGTVNTSWLYGKARKGRGLHPAATDNDQEQGLYLREEDHPDPKEDYAKRRRRQTLAPARPRQADQENPRRKVCISHTCAGL